MVELALIGFGNIAHVHTTALSAVTTARVAAVVTRHPELATDLPPEATIYLDLDSLLEAGQVQAVDICTPTYLHAEMAIAALQAGCDVICEKPMALTVDACDRMIAAAEATGQRLYIAHYVRFMPEISYLKARIDDGTFGRVTTARFHRLMSSRYIRGTWFADPARSGGCLLDLHIHEVDTVRYLFGDPRHIYASGTIDDGGISQVRADYHYAPDISVTSEGAWHYHPPFTSSAGFVVRFEGATVLWERQRTPLTVYPAEGDPFTPDTAGADGFTRMLAHYADCIQHRQASPIISALDARESVRLTAALAASVRSGCPVPFSDTISA
jgi:predicted dehydrogenase